MLVVFLVIARSHGNDCCYTRLSAPGFQTNSDSFISHGSSTQWRQRFSRSFNHPANLTRTLRTRGSILQRLKVMSSRRVPFRAINDPSQRRRFDLSPHFLPIFGRRKCVWRKWRQRALVRLGPSSPEKNDETSGKGLLSQGTHRVMAKNAWGPVNQISSYHCQNRPGSPPTANGPERGNGGGSRLIFLSLKAKNDFAIGILPSSSSSEVSRRTAISSSSCILPSLRFNSDPGAWDFSLFPYATTTLYSLC